MDTIRAIIFDLDGVICFTDTITIRRGKNWQMQKESILMRKLMDD